jgi:hypothetical protein
MHRDPLWIIVACRQIKKKTREHRNRYRKARWGWSREEAEGKVSKHVEQLVKKRGRW